MMSENRSKPNWSSDPRNTAWSQDTNKFGYRMLNKMGWSAGKGLGIKEDGDSGHIKIKIKNNNLGVGANVNNCSDWTKQQDDFSVLLSNLNNVHGQTTTDNDEANETANNSIFRMAELNGKKAKYHKVLKCKDVQNYSKTDLTCIFGRSHSSPELSSMAKCSNPSKDSNDKNFGVKTISSQMNLKEYFASKSQNKLDEPRKKAKLIPCKEESDDSIDSRAVSFKLYDDEDTNESNQFTDKRNSKDCANRSKISSKKKKRKEKRKNKKIKKSSK
ncbi:uncharacterized protein TRIADDRAFT_56912 [Trichoplax adhaerens]|uniref:G-patch domain-containing protein n=1 Tax=Trichoplax adhaerens TaxID=10228 RepID=B3RWW9_TRIAD|nr:hypothetical protein TRIADDRAFT_56912 [Trichoplax adhaerens]EDV24769.1 hypothetical protein TRIADDRAFT_56912 [Trichoplax adhaerens]|eukprot:XP_002112659.1 hypothetical protein TRIADDRAFT_56912 [Trichoplax adhaerens]